MGSHSYLMNLNTPTIVIGDNTGTINIPSQPVRNGGEMDATINGVHTHIREGHELSNVHGVVHTKPDWLHTRHELDYSVHNVSTPWCLDIGIVGTRHGKAEFVKANYK